VIDNPSFPSWWESAIRVTPLYAIGPGAWLSIFNRRTQVNSIESWAWVLSCLACLGFVGGGRHGGA
jgi:hypothetical protein